MKKPKDFSVILERIEAAENWRDSVYKDRWKEYLDQYRSKAEEKEEGRSNIFIPQTFMMVETVKSRVAESLFANRPYVSVLPRGSDDGEKARASQSLLDWQFNERMGIKRIFSQDILQDATVLGTTISYTGWLKKERKVKGREMVDTPLEDGFGGFFLDEMNMPIIMPVQQTVEDTVAIYDDPIVQKVDLFDFFVDKTATNTQDARFCGHMEWLTKAQIQNLEETAGWDINWKDLAPVQEVSGGKKIRAAVIGGTSDADGTYTPQNKGGKYEILHYWEDNRHMAIINRQECAIDEENPHWHGMKPYDKCCYVPLTNEFYGMGIPEIVADLQSELNTSRNMRIDYNATAMRRMIKVRKDCGLTAKDLIVRQNGILWVDELDDLEFIDVQMLPASAFGGEEVTKADMRYATGVHDIVMGLSDSSEETATTTMTKDNNASIRFKYFIEAIVDDMLVPIAEKCISLDQQYLEEDRVLRLADGEEGGIGELFTVTPDDLSGKYDLIYVGSSVEPMANKELYKQKVLEVYNLAMANPLVQQDFNIQRNLLKELFRAAEIKDYSSLIPDAPQPMPMGTDMGAGSPIDGMHPLPPGEPIPM